MHLSKKTSSKIDEITNQISNHINELIILSKTLSFDENIVDMENEASAWMESEWSEGNYWRGADMQVVKCSPGSSSIDFTDELIQYDLSADEPCPSRFPVLMTGLINRVQKKAYYLGSVDNHLEAMSVATRFQHAA